MKKLIGISGKARSGKDAIAKYLWEQYGFTRIAFADPVKLATQQIFGLSEEAIWGDALKEVPVEYWGLSPRQMFQLVGTECVKPYFGEDIWVKRWALIYRGLSETDDVIVPDVRFEAEAAYLRSIGGIIVHLDRPGTAAVNAHVSEAGIMRLPGDRVIRNTGTLDDLFKVADALVEGA